jgi:uncharacterized membrane protein YdjX (TVP38/TMEM64 family)
MLIGKIIKANKGSFLYILFLFILTISSSSTLLYLCYKYESSIKAFSFSDWLLVFVVLNFAMSLSLCSTTVAAVLFGYFLGWTYLPAYIIIYLTATVTGNLFAKWIDKGKFIDTIKSFGSTDRYLEAIEEDQLGLIILARISPVFPFSIMNVFLAAADFRLGKILAGSLIGMLPRTVISFWLGSQFQELRKLIDEGFENNIMNIFVIALIIISLIGLYIFINNIIKKASSRMIKGDVPKK